MSSRGPRLLIPSGLLGVGATTLAVLSRFAYTEPARPVLVAIIVVVAIDGARAFNALRRLDARMATPTVVTTGMSFEARADISGVSRPATVDPLFPDARPTHFEGTAPFSLTCHPAQRGAFNHLLIEVRCRSPLGLWAAARRIAVLLPSPLWVAPVPRPVEPPPTERPPRPAGSRATGGPRDQVLRSARPYEPGDSRRLVHWPATAHEGHLMVRETEAEADPLPALAVDLHGAGPAAEETLGRAATAAADALSRDGRVRLVTAERIVDDTEIAIPRSVLMPTATLRIGTTPVGATRTVDRIETTLAAVQRRLAVAAPAPVDRDGLPAGAWYLTEAPARGTT